MGRVICPFPAISKLSLCKNNNGCIGLVWQDYYYDNNKNDESSSKLNSNWPNNYLEAIFEAKRNYDFVFISSISSLLCQKNNIHYDLIYPSLEYKEQYLARIKRECKDISFIQEMEEKFEEYVIFCREDKFADEKIELSLGEYLEDGIRQLREMMYSPLLDNFSSSDNLVTTEKAANIYRRNTKKICVEHEVKYSLVIFDNSFIDFLINNGIGVEIGRFYSGSDYSKIVLVDNFLVSSSFLGGPNASALMEELAYYGVKYFLSIGTSCNLNQNNDFDCMIVKKAIRDEGTSLFYKEPSLYAYTSNYLNELLASELNEYNINFYHGITWTIDAYYRESLARMERRIEQGATSIDMESSVWCSVSESLDLYFSQILFFTDRVKQGNWSKGKSNSEIKKDIFNLGVEISRKLVKRLGK